MRIEELFAELDEYTERVPLDFLRGWLEDAPLELERLQTFARFHPRHYVRNLVHHGPSYQALLLCWRNGQRSPVHDHTGSSCAVRVLLGTATETLFQPAPNGMVYATESLQRSPPSVCASQDADVHQMSNLQAGGRDLITLHLYSPPLLKMNTYSLTEAGVTVYDDPVNEEFVSGGGI